MSTDITTSDAPGIARRTVLKVSAWSVPVIAAAVSTPMAAASTAVDLELTGFAGDTFIAFSPDRFRMYSIGITSQMRARAVGTTPTAAGSTLTISYDNRLLDGPSVRIDSTAAIAQSPTVNGNTTSVTFTLPVPIPATEVGAIIAVDFATSNMGLWLEDVAPYSTLLLPASGSDSNSSNNGWTSTAEYADTSDAAVSATWRPVSIANGNGDSIPCEVAETVTITANAPGNVPAGGSVHISGPTASTGFDVPYTYVESITGVTVTSALLDGVDVSALIGTPSPGMTFSIPVNTEIPAGQSLVLGLDVAVIDNTTGWVWAGGSAGFTNYSDREPTNNNTNPATP